MKLVLADGLNVLEDGPLDTLSAGRGGQGTVVGPEVVLVDGVNESLEEDLNWCGICRILRKDWPELFDEEALAVTAFFSIEENA